MQSSSATPVGGNNRVAVFFDSTTLGRMLLPWLPPCRMSALLVLTRHPPPRVTSLPRRWTRPRLWPRRWMAPRLWPRHRLHAFCIRKLIALAVRLLAFVGFMCSRLSRQCAEAILETQAEELAPEEEYDEGTVSLNHVLGMCGVSVGAESVGTYMQCMGTWCGKDRDVALARSDACVHHVKTKPSVRGGRGGRQRPTVV